MRGERCRGVRGHGSGLKHWSCSPPRNPGAIIPTSRPSDNQGNQRLQRRQRLTHSRYFKEAYGQGKRFVGKTMVMWLRHGEDADLRLGVVASKKVGNAIARARAKRRLREAYRRNREHFQGPYDVVLVARAALLRAEWKSVVEELKELARRANLLTKS